VLAWAGETGGRLVPFCRLDPREQPVAEAQRCVALGARGIKLHPRAQGFTFAEPAAAEIFAVARDAGVPILIHAGRGLGPMDELAQIAQRFPEVPLVLAHAGIADQGMFASRLRDHPAILYDTSCFSAIDVVELFARVPAERIVFASDIPYGRPLTALHLALRVAAYAGLDDGERALVVGGTMAALVDGRPLPAPQPPRVGAVRPVHGRLMRTNGYIATAFGAMIGGGPPPDGTRGLPHLALARASCRDPDSGRRRCGARADRRDPRGGRAADPGRRRDGAAVVRADGGGRRDRRHRACRPVARPAFPARPSICGDPRARCAAYGSSSLPGPATAGRRGIARNAPRRWRTNLHARGPTRRQTHMSDTTRAQFLRRAGGSGLALVAGGSVLGLAQGSALAATASGDVAIAKLAATAELLAIDFYTKAIASKQLKGDELSYLGGALGNEHAHYAALKGVLGSATPKGLSFSTRPGRSARARASARSARRSRRRSSARTWEPFPRSGAMPLKGVAAEIGACESRHLSVLTNIAANAIVPAPDLPEVLTAAQATKALTPFIG